MLKVGLLGGTFDPVHSGHLQLGYAVLDRYDFNKIILIPSARPPHKNEAIVCNIKHRLQMLKLGIGHKRSFEISEIEISRNKASYTIETLAELKQQSGEETQFYFIIGYDAISEIETWYRWEELLTSTNFIVALRPGFSVKEIEQMLERNGFTPDRKNKDRWIQRKRLNEIIILAEEIVDISSTDIRARISSGQAWNNLVPPPVEEYIIKHQLYTR